MFIVKIVLAEGCGCPVPENLGGEIGPPNYNSLKIIVNWGKILESGSYDIKINIIFNRV